MSQNTLASTIRQQLDDLAKTYADKLAAIDVYGQMSGERRLDVARDILTGLESEDVLSGTVLGLPDGAKLADTLAQMLDALDETVQPLLTSMQDMRAFYRVLADMRARVVEQTTKALTESETRLRSVFENLQDAVYRTDLEGKLVWCSPSAAEMFGADSVDELIGRDIAREFYAVPEEREEFLAVLRERGRVTDYEVTLHRGDGSEIIISTNSAFYYDESGEVAGVEGSFRDVTERRRTEEALRTLQERFQDVALSTSDWVWEIDAEGRYIYCSERVEDVLGYKAEELLGWTLFDFMTLSELERVGRIFRQAFAELEPLEDLVHWNYHKDGRLVCLRTDGVPVLDDEGEFHGYRGVAKDITEQVRTEENLNARLRYEQGLSACSQALLSGHEDAIDRALTALLEASGACRVYIFENFQDAEDGLCMRQTHEAVAPGVMSRIDFPELQHLPYSEGFERWREVLSQREAIAGVVDVLPPSEQAILVPQGIQAILILPIWVDGRWYGFIAFDDTKQVRQWNEGDVQLLQTASEMIGGYIERQRAEHLIRVQRDLGLALSRTTDPEEIYHLCVETAMDFAGMSAGAIALVNQTSESLDLVFSVNLSPAFESFISQMPVDLLMAGEPVYRTHDTGAEPAGQLRAMAIIPVEQEEQVVAALLMVSHEFDVVPFGTRSALEAIAAQLGSVVARARALAALEASETRFRTLFDHSADAILLLENGQFIDMNQTTVEMLRAESKAQLLDISPDALSPEYQPDGRRSDEKAQAMIDKALAEGTHRFEWVHRRLDGEDFYVEVVLTAIHVRGRQILHTVWRDITERKETEQRLRESEEEFRTLYEATSDAVMLLDDDRFFACNSATLDIFGCERYDQIIGKHPAAFSPEYQPNGQNSMDLAAERIDTAIEKGSCLFEWWHRRLDGTEFPAEVLLTPMNLRGRTMVQAVVRDISERKHAEEEIEQSLSLLQATFESVADGILAVDTEGNIVTFNQKFMDIWGIPEDLLETRDDEEVWDYLREQFENPDAFFDKMQYDTPEAESTDLLYLKDGRVLERYTVPQRVGDQIVGRVWNFRDITERMQAEAALREANAQFRATLSALPDLLFEVSCEGRFERVYTTDPEQLLMPVDAFIGKHIGDILPPDATQIIMDALTRAIDAGRDTGASYALEGPDGTEWYELSVALKEGDEDTDDHFVILIRDVTDRKQLELAQTQRARLYSQFSQLLAGLLVPMPLSDKLSRVTDWVTEQMETEFCRIWLIQENETEDERYLQLQAGTGWEESDVHDRLALGESIIGDIAADGAPKFLTNDLSDPAYADTFGWAQEMGLEAFAGYRLNTPDGEVLGVLAMFSDRALTPEDDAFLESVAGATSLVVRTAALEQESIRLVKAREEDLRQVAQRRAEQVRISTEVAQEIAAATGVEELYRRVVALVKERFGYYHVQIFNYDPAQNAMILVTGYGEPGKRLLARDHKLAMGSGVVGTALASGEPVLAADVREDPYWVPNPDLPETRGELAVPITWRGEVLGILDVQSDEANALGEEDELVLQGLCGQIAIAINATRLLEQANIFRQFADASGQGLGMADLEGNFIYVNPTLIDFLGAEDAEAMTGEKVFDYYPDDVRERVESEIMPRVQERGQWSGELPLLSQKGDVRDTIQNIFIVYGEDGEPRYIANAITDITARKRAEESFRLFRRLADASGQGLGMATLEGTIIYANPTLSNLLEEPSPEDMLGKSLTTYYSEEFRRRLPDEILPAVMEEGQWMGELALTSRKGRTTPTIENFFLIRDEQGQPLYLADIVTDITSQKEAEAEMEERLRELNALYRAMSQEGWQSYREVKDLPPGYLFEQRELKSAGDLWMPEIEQATRQNKLVIPPADGGNGATVAPLSLRGGEVIGALGVYDDPQNPLSAEDLALIDEVSDQVAQALESARLFEQTQLSLAETELLYDISQIIGNAQTIETILEGAATLARFLQMRYVSMRVFTQRDQAGHPVQMSVYALPLDDEASEMRSFTGMEVDEDSLHLLTGELDELLVYPDANNPDIEMPDRIRKNLLAGGNRGVVIAWLGMRNQTIGLLSFASSQTLYDFTPRDKRLIVTVADQASVTLDNIQLLQQTEESLTETEKLYHTSSTLTSAMSSEDVFKAVLSYAEGPEFDRALVAVLEDPDASPSEWEVVTKSVWTRTGDGDTELGVRFDSERIPFRSLVREPLVVNDFDDSALAVADSVKETFRSMGVRSVAIVPIATGGRAFGWVIIQSFTQTHNFTDREVQNLRTVTEQAAVILDNQRLLIDSRRRAEEMSFLFRVTQAATAGAIDDLEGVLRAVVDVLYDFLRAYEIDILIVESEEEEMLRRMVCTRGADVGQLVPYERTSVGWVARHVEPLIIEDTAIDRRFSDFSPETRSALVVPIAAGRELSGVLQIQSQHYGNYDDQVLRLLQAISGSLHAVIQNVQLLQEVQEANVRLGELNKLKSEFLASTSHELRTPLNSIIGFSRVMLKGIDGPLNDMQRADLQTIHNSGQHLLTLINDILDQSKIEAGQMELSFEHFQIGSVIHEVVSTVSVQVSEKPVDLIEDAAPGLPQVWGDEFRTRQILINLVNNAIKFTESGSVTVSARPGIKDDGREMVHVAVKDTGIGIKPEDHYKLFEAFRQVDNTTTRKYGGTGLGLPITKSLIELQGGEIWVDSEVGKGTTFTFSIPMEPEPEEEDEEALAVQAETTEEEEASSEDAAESTGPVAISFFDDDDEDAVEETEPDAEEDAELEGPIAISFDEFDDDDDEGSVEPDGEAEIEGPVAISFDEFDVDSLEDDDYTAEGRASGAFAVSFDREPEMPLDVPAQPKVVLVLDDEWGVINMYRRYLIGGGYEVLGTTNPASLKQMVVNFQPFVVLLDVVLPNSDVEGWDVLEELKSDPDTAGIPVIVCSIVDEPERGLEMGAAGYLVKPFLEDELVQAVQALEAGKVADEEAVVADTAVEAVDEAAEADEPEDKKDEIDTQPVPEPPPQPKVVLTLDDEWDTINLYRRYLLGGGYEVLGTTSPDNLVKMVEQFKPFVVLLDVMMPDADMDGWDVLAQLKDNPELQDVPVVLCSVIDEPERGLEMGAAAYLVKPFSEKDLIEVVKRIDRGEPATVEAGEAEVSTGSTGPAVEAEADADQEAEDIGEAVEEPQESDRPKVVIVLDDEWDTINLYRRYLLGGGYEVLGTTSPDNLVNMAKQFKPITVLLDLILPDSDMDGWDVLEQLKEEDATADIPVVICTILDEEHRALEEGAAEFLVKPILEQDLVQAVRRVELDSYKKKDA